MQAIHSKFSGDGSPLKGKTSINRRCRRDPLSGARIFSLKESWSQSGPHGVARSKGLPFYRARTRDMLLSAMKFRIDLLPADAEQIDPSAEGSDMGNRSYSSRWLPGSDRTRNESFPCAILFTRNIGYCRGFPIRSQPIEKPPK